MSKLRSGSRFFAAGSQGASNAEDRPDGARADRKQDVLEVIEAELIPRLRWAHRLAPASDPAGGDARNAPGAPEIHELARLAAHQDLSRALALVGALCREGLSLEAALLELIPAAARLLGEQWMSGLRTLEEFTAAMGALQQLVRELGAGGAAMRSHPAGRDAAPGVKSVANGRGFYS